METSNAATLLLLSLPDRALAGIDLLSFTTTPRFQGIKHLPPGLHFIFTSTNASLSVRHGAWFNVTSTNSSATSPPDLFIKKWDAATETLLSEHDATALLRWRANLGGLWREALTPYRQSASASASTPPASSTDTSAQHEEIGDWPRLTSHISLRLLTRICGPEPNHWSLTSASSAKRDMDDIPGLAASEASGVLGVERELGFLPVELRRTWREGAMGRERTEGAKDRSWALGDLVARHCGGGGGDEVLGEMQFCFLMVLTLNNYSCLEQWKRILELLFTCVTAVEQRSGLFVEMVKILRLQLQHCEDVEGGLIDLADDGAGLLRGWMRRFRKGLESVTGAGKQEVVDEMDELQEYLKERHGWEVEGDFVRRGIVQLEDGEEVELEVGGWDEEEEEGDWAPVVVELTDEQREMVGGGGDGNGIADAKNVKAMKEMSLQERDQVEKEEEEEDEQDLDDMDTRY